MGLSAAKRKNTDKRKGILRTAARLFARQGYDSTPTLQIAAEAGVTEPLIFYHFSGKEDLFTSILTATFTEYFARLDALPNVTASAFEKIEALIEMHFAFVGEMPHETRLIAGTCPAKLNNPGHLCIKNIRLRRERLTQPADHYP